MSGFFICQNNEWIPNYSHTTSERDFFLKFDILFLYGSVKVFYAERDYKKHATLCEQYTSWHKMKFSVRKMSTGGSTMMIDLVISVRLLMLLLPLDAVAGFLN